jgi:hypothetical protein
MKKNALITKINSTITDHDLDFDLVAEDTKDKVATLKDLLADVEDAYAETVAPPVVRVSDLCKEHGKDPKTVRARLRRLYNAEDISDLPVPVEGKQRWTFAEDAREAVEALVLNEG